MSHYDEMRLVLAKAALDDTRARYCSTYFGGVSVQQYDDFCSEARKRYAALLYYHRWSLGIETTNYKEQETLPLVEDFK